jgi:hypothetical protein
MNPITLNVLPYTMFQYITHTGLYMKCSYVPVYQAPWDLYVMLLYYTMLCKAND